MNDIEYMKTKWDLRQALKKRHVEDNAEKIKQLRKKLYDEYMERQVREVVRLATKVKYG